jgi:hypothetical protein
VVRGGVEPPTFRFSEGLSLPGNAILVSPPDLRMCTSRASTAILAACWDVPGSVDPSVGFLWGRHPDGGLVGDLWGLAVRLHGPARLSAIGTASGEFEAEPGSK